MLRYPLSATATSVHDHVAANRNLVTHFEDLADARQPTRQAQVDEEVDCQAPARREQGSQPSQEGPGERTAGELLAAEEVDGDVVEALGTDLDVSEGIGHNHFEAHLR